MLSLKIFLHTGEEVPEHEEVEADEEPEYSSNISNQSFDGVSQLLFFHQNFAICKYKQ